MITLSERNKYIAAHVTRATHAALKTLAKTRDTSISALVSEAVTEKLTREGISVHSPSPADRGEPLPFEPSGRATQ